MRPGSSLGRVRKLLLILSGLFLGQLLPASPAEANPTLSLARPLAMGDAYRAAGAGNGAIYANPAGMSRFRVYSVEWSYLNLPATDHTLNVSVVDTKTQPVGVGTGYTFVPGGTMQHEGALALSYPLIPDRFLLGGELSYCFLDNPDQTANEHAFSTTVGTMIYLSSGFFLGAVVHNLFDESTSASDKGRSYGMGIAWEGAGAALLAADLVIDPRKEGDERFSYHGGIEYHASQDVALRGGWIYKPGPSSHSLSLGLAFVSPVTGLEFAYRQQISGDTPFRSFVASVRMFL